MLKNLKSDKVLIAIVLLAFLIRLPGAWHAFPLITHPDEPTTVRSALALRFDLNPHHFDWPHLQYYILYLIYWVFIKARGLLQLIFDVTKLQQTFPLFWRDPLVFYFLGRLTSIVMGALTVVPVYLTAKLIGGKRAAVASALILTFIPYHIWHGHYSLLDVPMTFWASWTIYYSARSSMLGSAKDFVLFGLFVGFAASTKYNGGLYALLLPCGLIANYYPNFRQLVTFQNIKKCIAAGIASFVGFVVGTPFFIFDFNTFLRTDSAVGGMWQFKNVGRAAMDQRLTNFIAIFSDKFNSELGLTLTIFYVFVLFITGWHLCELLFRSNHILKYPKLVYCYVLVSAILLFYVAGFDKQRSQYLIFCYPLIALSCGLVYTYLTNLVKPMVAALVFGSLIGPSIVGAGLYVVTFMQPDSRNSLNNWLLANLRPGDTLIYFNEELLSVLDRHKVTKIMYNKQMTECPLIKSEAYILVSGSLQEILTVSPTPQAKEIAIIRPTRFGTGPNIKIFKL